MSSPLPSVQTLVAFQNDPCDDPALITSVASPAGTLGGAGVWTDISAYVSSYTTQRGRQHELQQFEAGTCEFDLNNVDGRFSSWNTSGPYYGFLLPRKLVQVRVTWSAVVYKRFTGHVDAWPTVWADAQSNFAQLHASDAFRMFNLADITTGGYAAQVVADGASTYYRLSDPGGASSVADLAGGHRAYVFGTVTFGQPGALNADAASSASFASGSTPTGFLGPPPSIATTGTAFTFEVWVNAASWPFLNYLLAWYNGPGFGVSVFIDSNQLNFTASDGTASLAANSTTTVPAGAWTHLVVTRSGGTVLMYINGVSVGVNTSAAGNPSAVTPTSVFVAAALPAADFPGSMQEVAIYPTALTPTQVANHFQLAAFPQEGTGARINRVLTAINWSAGARAIDTGYSTVQANTQTLTTTSSLSHMQDVECTEGGALFMSGSGQVTFLSRQTLFGNALYITSQQTIGDNTAAGDLPFQPGPVLALDDIDLYNEATGTRNGGLTQLTDNNTSIEMYGRVTWEPPATLLGISDPEVATLTQYIVQKYSTPVERLQSITVNLLELITPGTVADLLALDLLYRITVERTVVPGGGTAFSQVLNIEHIVETVTPDTWTVEFATALADPGWWILGTSALGTGTRLAY